MSGSVPPPVEGPLVAPPTLVEPSDRATLVDTPDTTQRLTATRSVDVRTAIARGLAEYLETLSIDWNGGRKLAFKESFASYAEPEDVSNYPTAVVLIPNGGMYDASSFTPVVAAKNRIAEPDGRVAVKTCEFETELDLRIWATDKEEREGLVTMLEDGLAPVDFMYGFRLDIPYYFGQRAEYEMVNSQYLDDEDSAIRGFRKANFSIRARVPVVRLKRYPGARMRAVTSTTGGS